MPLRPGGSDVTTSPDPGDIEALLAQPSRGGPAKRPGPSHPKGWEPGIDTARGTLVARVEADESGAAAGGPDWSHVLTNLGFDPEAWEVDGDVAEVRSWDTAGGVRCFYYKAKVRPLRTRGDDPEALDIEALCDEVRKRGPLKAATDRVVVTEGGWLVVVLTDWQAGKGTRGGAKMLAERVARLGAAIEQRVAWLRSTGVQVRGLALLLGGDLVEACDGHYAMQKFEVELDGRQQTKMVRRLLVNLVDRLAPMFDRVVFVVAAGNHGEKRRNGKADTSWSDNLDVEIPEQVADALAMNPERYGHVSFILPDAERLTATVDLDGLVVGIAHGHQMRGGGATVQAKVLTWWRKQAFARHPIGDAHVLVTGHFHHFEVYGDGDHEGGSRVWFQAPALDGGSPWWEQTGGGATFAGTLTFVAAHGDWSHLEVLRADGPPSAPEEPQGDEPVWPGA